MTLLKVVPASRVPFIRVRQAGLTDRAGRFSRVVYAANRPATTGSETRQDKDEVPVAAFTYNALMEVQTKRN